MTIGDKIPEVLGIDQDGREIKASDYRGRKIVLYSYPKANTSGCTAEACSLQSHKAELAAAGYEIFGEKTGFYTKDELQKAIIHLCGGNKRLAVSLMYGIPAAFNINLSSRAGMSDVIPTSLGDFAGPTISKSVRLAQDLLGGDYANALRDVNPGLYNLYAAGTGESRGKRDRLNDRYVTAWDRILRAVGFRSVDETIPTDMQRIISRDKAAATKERQEAQDAYIQNPTSENKQRLKDLGIKEKDVQKEANLYS